MTGPQVEAENEGGSGLRTRQRKAESRRDHPQGLSGTLATLRAAKRGRTDRGRGRRDTGA